MVPTLGMAGTQPPGQLAPFAETIPVQELAVVKPEMREFPETRVLFVRRTGTYGEAASAAWGVLMGFAYGNRLMKAATLMIGIGYDDTEEQ